MLGHQRRSPHLRGILLEISLDLGCTWEIIQILHDAERESRPFLEPPFLCIRHYELPLVFSSTRWRPAQSQHAHGGMGQCIGKGQLGKALPR